MGEVRVNQLDQIKTFLQNEDLRKRFGEMLGSKANQFTASILNSVSANKSLQECDPKSIISAALVAASLDLPIDSNLGFAAMVPYGSADGKKAQFQIMAKGFVQLAIRSGQYSRMNYSEVYEDELKKYNPITKEIHFDDTFKPDGQREKGFTEKIVGYYAWFELNAGFKQDLYMTVNQVRNHAKKYSISYKYDLSQNKTSSKWSQDFDPMAKKTVIKLLLSKWGILSVDMQSAIKADQKVFTDDDGKYLDTPEDEAPIDVEAKVTNPYPETDERYKKLKEKNPTFEHWQIVALMKEEDEAKQ